VRVTSATHPLSGRVVAARSFKRLHGELLLVIELPDGSPGTIAAAATDVLGAGAEAGPAVVLDAAGWRRLRELTSGLAGRRPEGARGAGTQIGSPRS
jgi:microcompartment protein CcmK/EutM